MRRGLARALAVTIGIAACAAALAGPMGPTKTVPLDAVPKSLVVPVELTPLWQRQRSLGPGAARVYDARDGTLRDVPVKLVVTRYRCRYLVLRDGRASEFAQEQWCYELVSEPQEDDFAYTWSMWRWVGREDGPFDIRIFTPEGGGSYLTWTSGWQICLADVSHSRDRAVAFHEHLSAKPDTAVESVPVENVPLEMRTYWKRARFSEFTPWMVQIESLTRDEEGRLRLGLRDRMGGGGAVLVQQMDGQWTLGSYTRGSPETPPQSPPQD